jgi:hypothetical protein
MWNNRREELYSRLNVFAPDLGPFMLFSQLLDPAAAG